MHTIREHGECACVRTMPYHAQTIDNQDQHQDIKQNWVSENGSPLVERPSQSTSIFNHIGTSGDNG